MSSKRRRRERGQGAAGPSKADQEASEAMCRRCGKCCRDKYIIGDSIYFGGGSCRHLDPDTNLCTIYENRHEINPQCLSVEKGIDLGVFPAGCPYVADKPRYVPPLEIVIDDETLRLVERGKLLTPEELSDHLKAKAQAPARRRKKKRSNKRPR